MEKDYGTWLKDTWEMHNKKMNDAYYNYQETGNGRYYAVKDRNENYARALSDAIDMEAKRDNAWDKAERQFSALYASVLKIKDSYPTEEALDKIIETIKVQALYGFNLNL